MIDRRRDNIARNRFARLFPVLMTKNAMAKSRHKRELMRIMIDKIPMAGSPFVQHHALGMNPNTRIPFGVLTESPILPHYIIFPHTELCAKTLSDRAAGIDVNSGR